MLDTAASVILHKATLPFPLWSHLLLPSTLLPLINLLQLHLLPCFSLQTLDCWFLGLRALAVSSAWHALSLYICQTYNLVFFRTQIKCHLLNEAFSDHLFKHCNPLSNTPEIPIFIFLQLLLPSDNILLFHSLPVPLKEFGLFHSWTYPHFLEWSLSPSSCSIIFVGWINQCLSLPNSPFPEQEISSQYLTKSNSFSELCTFLHPPRSLSDYSCSAWLLYFLKLKL